MEFARLKEIDTIEPKAYDMDGRNRHAQKGIKITEESGSAKLKEVRNVKRKNGTGDKRDRKLIPLSDHCRQKGARYNTKRRKSGGAMDDDKETGSTTNTNTRSGPCLSGDSGDNGDENGSRASRHTNNHIHPFLSTPTHSKHSKTKNQHHHHIMRSTNHSRTTDHQIQHYKNNNNHNLKYSHKAHNTDILQTSFHKQSGIHSSKVNLESHPVDTGGTPHEDPNTTTPNLTITNTNNNSGISETITTLPCTTSNVTDTKQPSSNTITPYRSTTATITNNNTTTKLGSSNSVAAKSCTTTAPYENTTNTQSMKSGTINVDYITISDNNTTKNIANNTNTIVTTTTTESSHVKPNIQCNSPDTTTPTRGTNTISKINRHLNTNGSIIHNTTTKPNPHHLPTSPSPLQLYVVVATACVLVYVNGLTGEYVHDDLSAVVRNPDVQGSRTLWQVFLNDFWGRPMSHPASHKSYRPITILTFRLVHAVYGPNSMADHVVNLLVHMLVTLLYCHVLLHVLRLTRVQASISGLLFATHPVHTEAVTGVVGRADLLAALTFLAAFTSYHRATRVKTNSKMNNSSRRGSRSSSRADNSDNSTSISSSRNRSNSSSSNCSSTNGGGGSSSSSSSSSSGYVSRGDICGGCNGSHVSCSGTYLGGRSCGSYYNMYTKGKHRKCNKTKHNNATNGNSNRGCCTMSCKDESGNSSSCCSSRSSSNSSSRSNISGSNICRITLARNKKNSRLTNNTFNSASNGLCNYITTLVKNHNKGSPTSHYTNSADNNTYSKSRNKNIIAENTSSSGDSSGSSDSGSGSCNDVWWLRWSYVWVVVGVGCKETVLSVVVVCVAWDIITNGPVIIRCAKGRWNKCALTCLARRITNMITLAVLVLVGRLLMMRGPPVFSEQDNPASFSHNFITRLLTFLYLPAHNTWLLLCPSDLSYDWQLGSVPLVTSLWDPRNLASLALYLTLLLLALTAPVKQCVDGRAVLWSLLVMVLPFLPASNLFFRVGFVVAERLLYIPSLGWCTVVGLGAGRLLVSGGRGVIGGGSPVGVTRRRKVCLILLLLLLLMFSLRTCRRNRDWRTREHLFTSGLKTLPHNAKMHYNFANMQRDAGRSLLALHHYREAIRLWWAYPSAHNNLASLLIQTNGLKEMGHNSQEENRGANRKFECVEGRSLNYLTGSHDKDADRKWSNRFDIKWASTYQRKGGLKSELDNKLHGIDSRGREEQENLREEDKQREEERRREDERQREREAEWHLSVALRCHPGHHHAAHNLATLWRKQGRIQAAITLLQTTFDPEKEGEEETPTTTRGGGGWTGRDGEDDGDDRWGREGRGEKETWKDAGRRYAVHEKGEEQRGTEEESEEAEGKVGGREKGTPTTGRGGGGTSTTGRGGGGGTPTTGRGGGGGDTGRLLADLLLQEGRRKESESVFLSLVTAHPENPDILADYAVFLHKIGRREAAIRHYESCLSLSPAHPAALAGYAALHATANQHQPAISLYARSLKLSWCVDTAVALARLYLLTGALQEAESLLSTLTTRHPAHLTARVYMAQVHLQQKRYSSSEDLLEGVLRGSPGHQAALYHLSLLYVATNRTSEALAAATAAAAGCREAGDTCATLHAHHADLLHTTSFMDQAVTSYQLAVSLEPELSRAHLNLGAIYHTQGRSELAMEHYQKAFAQDPNNTLLLDNIQKLRRAMGTAGIRGS